MGGVVGVNEESTAGCVHEPLAAARGTGTAHDITEKGSKWQKAPLDVQ